VAYVNPPPRPGATLWSIAAGPLVNVVLVPVLSMLGLLSRSLGWAEAVPDFQVLLRAIWFINFALLIFNMLPIYPLDGGQILRSLLWYVLGRARSLMVAAIIGLAGVAAFIGLAVWTRSVWYGAKYASHSRETNRGSLSPKAAVLFTALKGNKRGRIRSHQALAYRVTAGGFDLHRRDLRVGHRLAVRLVLAYRTVASVATLPADDSRGLRNAGRVSVDCEPQSARTLEPYLVHGVVERSARGHYGSAGSGELRPKRTPLG
jgi:Peptidase family M50